MADPENEESGELDVELTLPDPVVLMDDTAWIPDPDALHPDAQAEGVLALLYRERLLVLLRRRDSPMGQCRRQGAKEGPPIARPVT